MRRITREETPEFWSKSIRKYRNYDDLENSEAGRELRGMLRRHLIMLQGGLCAYCCKEIADENSLNEHIKPRSTFPDLSLDYDNLVASCITANTCGSKKGNAYRELFISPLDEHCEDHFKYTPDGSIVGTTTSGVYTCDLLNLNAYELKQARKALIKICRSYHNKDNVMNYYLHDQDTGNLRPFSDVIEYYCNTDFLI